jgi:hypothetical protein
MEGCNETEDQKEGRFRMRLNEALILSKVTQPRNGGRPTNQFRSEPGCSPNSLLEAAGPTAQRAPMQPSRRPVPLPPPAPLKSQNDASSSRSSKAMQTAFTSAPANGTSGGGELESQRAAFRNDLVRCSSAAAPTSFLLECLEASVVSSMAVKTGGSLAPSSSTYMAPRASLGQSGRFSRAVSLALSTAHEFAMAGTNRPSPAEQQPRRLFVSSSGAAPMPSAHGWQPIRQLSNNLDCPDVAFAGPVPGPSTRPAMSMSPALSALLESFSAPSPASPAAVPGLLSPEAAAGGEGIKLSPVALEAMEAGHYTLANLSIDRVASWVEESMWTLAAEHCPQTAVEPCA